MAASNQLMQFMMWPLPLSFHVVLFVSLIFYFQHFYLFRYVFFPYLSKFFPAFLSLTLSIYRGRRLHVCGFSTRITSQHTIITGQDRTAQHSTAQSHPTPSNIAQHSTTGKPLLTCKRRVSRCHLDVGVLEHHRHRHVAHHLHREKTSSASHLSYLILSYLILSYTSC